MIMYNIFYTSACGDWMLLCFYLSTIKEQKTFISPQQQKSQKKKQKKQEDQWTLLFHLQKIKPLKLRPAINIVIKTDSF